jgi:hypothetical protein
VYVDRGICITAFRLDAVLSVRSMKSNLEKTDSLAKFQSTVSDSIGDSDVTCH